MNVLVEFWTPSVHSRTTDFKLKERSLKRRNNSDLQLLFPPSLYLSIDWGGCMLWLIKINTFKRIQRWFLWKKRQQDGGIGGRGVTLSITVWRAFPLGCRSNLCLNRTYVNQHVRHCHVGVAWRAVITHHNNDGFPEMQSYLCEHVTIFSCLQNPQIGSARKCTQRGVCSAILQGS